MRRYLAHGLAIASLIVGLGAAQGPNISEAKAAPVSSLQSNAQLGKQLHRTKPYQVGTASWYGGEPYDFYGMTAAHLKLPMGSYVKVTNLRNGRSVVVRVNDRGPIVPGRIIDLSYGAAQALQFKQKGLQRVRLDLVNPRDLQPDYQTVAYNHPPLARLP